MACETDSLRGPFKVVIGLEVHAQVMSVSKLFSKASTTFAGAPNSQVAFFDAAFPGMLPVINTTCVAQAVRTGLGLKAQIHLWSLFDRKNYFYADLPQGYQISQYKHPIVGEGSLDIDLEDGRTKTIGIERLHLEQDAGKSLHDQDPKHSYIDLNRSGVALMEIVTKPDMASVEEAQQFVHKLRALLRCLKTCDGNMEQGSMRADVNISLHLPGTPLGTRAEIKNVNSIRFMGQAIAYEIRRQRALLEAGKEVLQETRLFDAQKGVTVSMRSKEDAHDYRYFPDPDLPPLVLSASFVEELRKSLPELPDDKKKRLMDLYNLSSYDANVLTADLRAADFFEAVLQALEQKKKGLSKTHAKEVANWMMGPLFSEMKKEETTFDALPVTPLSLSELIAVIEEGIISSKMAKDVFEDMWKTSKSPLKIIEEKGLRQVTDSAAIGRVIDEIMAKNADKVQEYQGGKEKLFGFFVGQVMKAMKGQGNPSVINRLLKEKLQP